MTENQNNQSQEIAIFGNEKGLVSYNVGGQEVKLSFNIVRNYLTKGCKNVPDYDVVQFIQICRFNTLNPFLGEAFLVKYDEKSPAQMVVSKEALMKRAETNEHYKGFKAGIIVKRGEGVEYLEGSFKMPEDTIVGGWAEVYRDDREFPVKISVSFSEYNKGQSTWKGMPGTMIRKVALAQALREAFSVQIGAMYVSEERDTKEPEFSNYEVIKTEAQKEVEANANNGEQIGFTPDQTNQEQVHTTPQPQPTGQQQQMQTPPPPQQQQQVQQPTVRAARQQQAQPTTPPFAL